MSRCSTHRESTIVDAIAVSDRCFAVVEHAASHGEVWLRKLFGLNFLRPGDHLDGS